MSDALQQWNSAEKATALASAITCCGSTRWAGLLVQGRPFSTPAAVYSAADSTWAQMQEEDWLEAFACHPRIGERARQPDSQHGRWSTQEQKSSATAAEDTLAAIAQGNLEYEKKNGFTYIVCATGKSAEQMLAILLKRLQSDRRTELKEAAEQQRQILQIRLRKWLEV